MIFGSHGEVEIVALNVPRPRFHGSGIALRASNCGPLKGPATLSLRTIVGGCTGNVSSTASDIFTSDFATASNRIFAGTRSTSTTFALNRNTVGASRLAVCVALPSVSSLQLASVTQRAVISSESENFCCTTARNSTSSPLRRKRGSAGLMSSGLETWTVALASPPN